MIMHILIALCVYTCTYACMYVYVYLSVNVTMYLSGVVVNTGSLAAVRAAKDVQESVLFPLSQEMFLEVKLLSNPLQGFSSPSATPSGT